MSTIHTDVAENLEHGVDADATDAFSKLFGVPDAERSSDHADEDDEDQEQGQPAKDEPTEDDAEGDDEGSEETPETDEDAEGDDEDGDKEGDEPTVEIKDDHKIKVKVDGEDQEFTFGQLKRLAGQEAALTRKSQEVATVRKTVGEQGAVLLAQQNALLDRAKARYAPYANIDLLAASKDPNISAEELVAVRNAAKAAYEDVQYLETETSRVAEALRHQAQQELMEQAQGALKELSDPEKGIEGFSQQMYGEICQFAVDTGLPTDIVNNLVNPAAIKLINMARLYAKGQQKVQSSEKSDKKKAPKRIVKGTASVESTKKIIKTAKAAEPIKRLRKSGSVDDAANAFEASWSRSDED